MNYVSSEEIASKPVKIDSVKKENNEAYLTESRGSDTDFLLKLEADSIRMTYRCVECDKIYFEEDELRRHNGRKHTSAYREHVCNICEKAYTQKGHLKEHKQRKHEGIAKPFKCDECE